MDSSAPRHRDNRELAKRILPALAPVLVLGLCLTAWIGSRQFGAGPADTSTANTSAAKAALAGGPTGAPTGPRTSSGAPAAKTHTGRHDGSGGLSRSQTRMTAQVSKKAATPSPTATDQPGTDATQDGAPAPDAASPQPVTGPMPGFGKKEAEVLRLVNVERSKVGCRPLRGNRNLALAARRHSQDMADHNYFDHTSQDGRDFSTRAKAAGYRGFPSAENIAAGSDTAAKTMGQWMNSEGHRTNILNCDYKDLGVGLGTGGGYRYYWTQDFGM
jgi:uncharacterized protein YkwD